VSTASQMAYIKQNSLIQHADLFKMKQVVVSSSSSLESFKENEKEFNQNDEMISIDDELSRDFNDFDI
jgi:hypothetical protein